MTQEDWTKMNKESHYNSLIKKDTANRQLIKKLQLEKEELKQQLNLSGVVKSLEIKEEIVFEDWLKQHRFTKDINDYVKNNITYREWEVFNMYTMDVYNL